jgi:hypothetical protein
MFNPPQIRLKLPSRQALQATSISSECKANFSDFELRALDALPGSFHTKIPKANRAMARAQSSNKMINDSFILIVSS